MLKLRFCKDFLIHRFKAKNRHGLHSPFVYRLVDIVFYDYDAKKVYLEIKKKNKDLFAPQNSTYLGLNTLKINRLLYRLVADIKPGNVVLLGHITPVTRLYLKKAAPAAKVYLDILNTPEKLNFVLVNNSDQILQYFENCLPKTDENTVMAFSDIYGSEETKKAWQQIKMHSQVTVTIDLFWIGLIFFRKGQVKEDFLIRI